MSLGFWGEVGKQVRIYASIDGSDSIVSELYLIKMTERLQCVYGSDFLNGKLFHLVKQQVVFYDMPKEKKNKKKVRLVSKVSH